MALPITPKPAKITAETATTFEVEVPCIIQGRDINQTIQEMQAQIDDLLNRLRLLENTIVP